MPAILSRLAIINFLLLLTTYGAGWLSWFHNGASRADVSYFLVHLVLALATVLVCLGVHCLIFIYFLGTGRWVKEVANAYQLPDEPLPKLTRELKRQAFPPSLFAMLVTIAAASTGGAAQMHLWHWGFHAVFAILALVINLWAFTVELRCVRANVGVLDGVMQEVERLRAAAGLPSNAEALRQEELAAEERG